MPRPAPSPEEEDILASLRRLMTADADTAGHPGEGPSNPGGATLTEAGTRDIGPEGERLLLTEALRVRASEGQDAGTGQAPAEESDDSAPDTDAEPFDDDAPEPDTSEMVAAVTRRLHLGDVEDDDTTDEDEDAPAEQAGAAQEDPEAAAPGDDTEGEHEQDSPETGEAEKMAQQATARAEDPQESDREPEDILREQDDESRILDEDTLREIVSQAVREELMGELGQRITRNVKKLVRREIQRALAGRAFEE